MNREPVNGGSVSATDLPHRPTFALEETRNHQRPGECGQIERAEI